ncbi:hypothetical protein KAZ57_02130 [Patescibacteria group bacterium]|nr:hypothetical protein [Patescibacteria group bacterium]
MKRVSLVKGQTALVRAKSKKRVVRRKVVGNVRVIKAKNCIVSCIDFRIQKYIYKWLKETHNLDKSDLIEVAGSSRDIVKPLRPHHKEDLLRNIQVSIELHDPDNIIVFDHQDCGGYAHDNTIKHGLSVEQDEKQHRHFSEIAYRELTKIFPDRKIYTYYVSLRGHVVKV